MNRRLRVRINMPVVIQHLSREEQRAVSTDEVRQWLEDAGFARLNDDWEVDEANLGHLDPSEVISVEPIDDDAA
jgi:hypothetical protein